MSAGIAVAVGLAGGIASGKSTVARWLAEAGFTVVDADELVASLYRSGEAGAKAVGELFGNEVLDPNGGVDHAALANKVFSDPEALDELEARIHPLVRAAFTEVANASGVPAILEATLLVEAGYAPDFDLLVTVEADPRTRVQRAVARGLSEPEAMARLEAQADRPLREKAAHRVLTNDGSLEDLRAKVDKLIDEIRSLEASKVE